jgi:diguanylate cyclase (GGDEF)-like protein
MQSEMDKSLKAMFMRHRFTIQDGAFVIGVILLAGLGAFEFSLAGSVEADKRIDFMEMLILGGIVVISVLYLGWRRVRAQEREINRRIIAERRAHRLAHTDPLTGLANRRQFESMLRAAVKLPRGPNEEHAVLMIDLNGFKQVNDVYGHAEGDEVLVATAARLRSAIRDHDLLGRLGGDEFAVIAYHLAGAEGATDVARRILKSLEQPIGLDKHQHRMGIGIGIALIPRDADSAEEALRKADMALYRAKNSSESEVRFFEEDMDRHVRERDRMERDLRAAIGTDALRPWYQPIVDLKSGELTGFEALARWSHPELGEIEPERFIPLAESSGLIRELGEWLLRCATTDALKWPDHVMLSFNISPAQLKDNTLGLHILRILNEIGLPPRRLELEITESAIVRDLEMAQAVLSSLREAGISIAIDDFGTGYSNLYHLRHFKLDKLKIDRSFIHTMESEPESAAIVRALTGLGNGLGLTIVAEGIEDKVEFDALLREGCQQGQGFLFSRAVPAYETAAFFADAAPQSKTARAG